MTYTPFFKYLKDKYGISMIYEILYGVEPARATDLVAMDLP